MATEPLLALVHDVVGEESLTTDMRRGSFQVVTLAPWQLWMAAHNPEFAAAVSAADGVTIDGRWLKACLRVARRDYPLVTGRHVFQWHFDKSHDRKIAVIGSSEQALSILRAKNPGWLCIGGSYGDTIEERQMEKLLSDIVLHKSTLVFVALGSPKQELWGRRIADAAKVTVIGIGGSVETAVGLRKAPSGVFTSLSLEWLQRTFQDPKRFVPRIAQAATIMPRLLLEAISMRIDRPQWISGRSWK